MVIHELIMVNAKPVSDPVDKIEIAGDKTCGANFFICPAQNSQLVNICFFALGWFECQGNHPI